MWSSDDIISTDKYLAFAQAHEPHEMQYHKRDYLFQPGVWRGQHVRGLSSPTNVVLVGHADQPLTNEDAVHAQERSGCKYIFSVNNTSTLPFAHGLPLGITNNTNESEVHPIYGNTDIMIQINQQPQVLSRQHLVYCNVNVNTQVSRKPIQEYFESKDWCLHEEPASGLESRKHFLQQIRSHKFTVAPAGNGVDTHRLWEALYMESIPIVQRHQVHADWQDLPILFVDTFEDVTPSLLNATFDELHARFQDKQVMQKLTIGWWKDRVEKCV